MTKDIFLDEIIRNFLRTNGKMTRKQLDTVETCLIDEDLNLIDKGVVFSFIEKYSKNDNSIFLVEIYKFLMLNDKNRADKYYELYRNRKTKKEKDIPEKKTKRKIKVRKDKSAEKKMRKAASERAHDQNKIKKDEKVTTKKKINVFYSNLQKFK